MKSFTLTTSAEQEPPPAKVGDILSFSGFGFDADARYIVRAVGPDGITFERYQESRGDKIWRGDFKNKLIASR